MTKTALIALLAMWGVGTCTPVFAQDTEAADEMTTEADADDSVDPLVNTVWIRSDQGVDGLPGVMQVFLADGTLLSDSCWETYRLSQWQKLSATSISWDEDGMTIAADIVSVTADELVLNLKLIGGDEEQRFAPASVPYVCPDMVR
ncbi:MAG: hypothetical protein JWR75_118 [Devosia sp.]|nr:hypothetical protein [Devosia sp.]